jgi:hypothetical protein
MTWDSFNVDHSIQTPTTLLVEANNVEMLGFVPKKKENNRIFSMYTSRLTNYEKARKADDQRDVRYCHSLDMYF